MMLYWDPLKGKRRLAVFLAVLMVLMTAACGKTDGEDSKNSQKADGEAEDPAPELVYTAAHFTVEGLEGTQSVQMIGSKVYTIYAGHSENGEGGLRQSVKKFEYVNGKLTAGKELLEVGENTDVSQFYVTDPGEIYLVMSMADSGSYSGQTQNFLVKYTARGDREFETDLGALAEGQDGFSVRQFAVDEKGRCYLYGNQELALYSETGSPAGKVSLGNISYLSGIGAAKDGKVYVSYYDNGGDSGGFSLAEVDFDKKSLGAKYKNFVGANTNFGAGIGADILVSDPGALYEYSLAEQKATKVLSWIDYGINGEYVRGYSVDRDGKVFVLTRDWESGMYELAVMRKAKPDEVVQKEKIVVGVISPDGDVAKQVRQQVVDFNKSTDRYQVEVKWYRDSTSWSDTTYTDAIARLSADLISGNGPDIIEVSVINDLPNYVKKGAIEDLAPWLEKSSVLKKSDFFDNILDEATYGGVLAYIPVCFRLETLVAKSSEVGDRMGWTLPDMLAYAKTHPETTLMEWQDKASVLQLMLKLNQDRFINTEKGECNLNSEEFKGLLEFANSFPEDSEKMDRRLTQTKLADGSLLLANAYISQFSHVQQCLAYCGDEKVTFIGYPSYRGGNGCLMSVQSAYAISSKSSHKEGAWEFIEQVLSTDITEVANYWGFSSRKSIYEKQKEEEMKVQYVPVVGEDGKVVLDENGEFVMEEWHSVSTWGSPEGDVWSYEEHPVTKEEADILEQLLNDAICVNYNIDDELMKIISETADGYFKGGKTLEEAASEMQNRVSLYIKENID